VVCRAVDDTTDIFRLDVGDGYVFVVRYHTLDTSPFIMWPQRNTRVLVTWADTPEQILDAVANAVDLILNQSQPEDFERYLSIPGDDDDFKPVVSEDNLLPWELISLSDASSLRPEIEVSYRPLFAQL
jgi:hypothetical protein